MKIKCLLLVFLTGCFLLFGPQSQAQKSILIEKGLAYLATTQSSTKGYTPGEGTSIDPDNLYQMTKTPGDWGGAGISGFCLQAFLQNGHNIDDPVYGDIVQNAIDYILSAQVTTEGAYHYGAFGSSSHYGYETGICVVALKLALETPLNGGGHISGQLKTDIETAVADGLNYYTQDVDESWTSVSWRYNRNNTSPIGGDMSVNQWVFLAMDAMDYEDNDIWNKVYGYMQTRKCTSGDYSYIGYQSCGTWTQGNTCAGVWGSVLAADHGIAGGSALKDEFFNYLDNFSLSQLIDENQINNNDVYTGGGYYYYLYEFSKAMALGNKTIFAGGDWYEYLYNAIESQYQTDGNGNYFWNASYGGQGNNMETALALLCLQTQSVPVGSTLKVSLDTNPGGGKADDCFEFSVSDELGNQAGYNGTEWFTNIPMSEWTSTTNDFYELTIEVQESTNYGVEIINTCNDPKMAELCYKTYLQDELTDEECFLLEEVLPFTPIGAAGFVNAIGGLNVIIVLPPTPIPQMVLDPTVLAFNPFEYGQFYEFTIDISETGNETSLLDIDVFASDLVDQNGNVIPSEDITITPNFIEVIPPGTTETVTVSFTTPGTLTFDPGLFQGNITAQTSQQAKGVNLELGSPEMTIDPMEALVPYTSGSTSFDISFTGLVGADWELDFDAAWITAAPMMGSGEGTVTINYEANPGDTDRMAVVTILAEGSANGEETFTITQEGSPFVFFTYADLEVSENEMDWSDVPGTIENGYMQGLDYNVDPYYFNLGDETATNLPLALGMYPFYLDVTTVPDDFYEWWAAQGVDENAVGGWEAIMYQIIMGNEPTFYVKAEDQTKDQMFTLVDGLKYLAGGVEEYLQVPGDYPTGDYAYSGTIESDGGLVSNPIIVMINFYRPELLQAELIVSEDQNIWETALGNLQNGYLVRLDEMIANYALNLGDNTYSNVYLMEDMYPFYLDPATIPEGFYEYWAARGVDENAVGGWEEVMWDIINGTEPTFYIKVEGQFDQDFTLVDGLQYLIGNGEEYLSVPGDYPLGSYMYMGNVMDEMGLPSMDIHVMITFASEVDQQLDLMVGWLGISSFIIPEDPAMETVLAAIEEDMVILVSNTGIYWPSQNINLIGDWNSYEGYKIKIIEPTMLEFYGFPAETTVDLPAGISFMPVLSPVPLPTEIFADMGDDLVYAFELKDQLVYWPEGGLNTIGTIEPGIGYLINLLNPVTVDFSAKAPVASQPVETFVNNSPWQDVTNTGNPHIISIDNSALNNVEPGDYIGLFGASGNIVGITEFKGGNQNLQLIANGDDLTTAEVDGLAQGEMMSLMVYKAAEDQAYHLEATFDGKYNQGVFEAGAVSMITELKVGALGIPGGESSSFTAFPNPTTGQLTITATNAYELEILNAAGQVVFATTTDGDASLDLSGLERGVYFLKASNENGLVIEKLVIE